MGKYFCDRFDFVYDMPLDKKNSIPYCRVSPNIEAGLYYSKY